MPKRASCHHCIRRMRSASSDEGLVWTVEDCKKELRGASVPFAARGSAPAASAEPVPFIQSRLEMRLSAIRVILSRACRDLLAQSGGLANRPERAVISKLEHSLHHRRRRSAEARHVKRRTGSHLHGSLAKLARAPCMALSTSTAR